MMAADLTSRGYEVNLCELKQFAGHMAKVLETREIEVSGIGPVGTFKIAQVGTDMGKALEGVEWIQIVLPATGHESFMEELVKHLKDGQKVVVWAGDFGSLRLRRMLEEKKKRAKVTIIETSTLPYGTRLMGPGKVTLLLTAPHVMVAAVPAKGQEAAIEALKEMFGCVFAGANALAAGFNNANPMVHPPGSLLNTGRIEYSGGDFRMYQEGITESVARVIREIYEESRRVARALGFDMTTYSDQEFATRVSIMGVEFVAPFDTHGVIGSILGPCSVQDRYITEDLPFGLVPRSELGDVVGVGTPVIEGIVSLGSVVCREDYWKTGRTLKKLGLAGMTGKEIMKMVEGGGVQRTAGDRLGGP